MNSDTETVYINDNPIGETEVYHARQFHATKHRWTAQHTRETTAAEAQAEGYRPCKQCYPHRTADACPACGHGGDGDEDPDTGQRKCPNDDCRVASFYAEADR